jgi:hypothetical protein
MKRPITLSSIIEILISIVYSLFCWICVSILSNHDYESWIGDNDGGGVTFTICTIPTSMDETYEFWIIPTLTLIMISKVRTVRNKMVDKAFISGLMRLRVIANILMGSVITFPPAVK